MMSDNQILEAIFNLFGWLYQINLPVPMRAAIEQQIASGWHNQDPSEQVFLSFLMELNGKLSQTPDPDSFRPNVLGHFRNEFAAAEQTSPNYLDDKGRLLLVIHWAIESTRPGSTGVASANAAATGPGGNQRCSRPAQPPQAYAADDPDQELRNLEAQQQRIQRDAVASATLSNIANMRYQMLKHVADNLKY
jgi:hypothetical protein